MLRFAVQRGGRHAHFPTRSKPGRQDACHASSYEDVLAHVIDCAVPSLHALAEQPHVIHVTENLVERPARSPCSFWVALSLTTLRQTHRFRAVMARVCIGRSTSQNRMMRVSLVVFSAVCRNVSSNSKSSPSCQVRHDRRSDGACGGRLAGGPGASNLQWVRATTFLKCSIAAFAPAVLDR